MRVSEISHALRSAAKRTLCTADIRQSTAQTGRREPNQQQRQARYVPIGRVRLERDWPTVLEGGVTTSMRAFPALSWSCPVLLPFPCFVLHLLLVLPTNTHSNHGAPLQHSLSPLPRPASPHSLTHPRSLARFACLDAATAAAGAVCLSHLPRHATPRPT